MQEKVQKNIPSTTESTNIVRTCSKRISTWTYINLTVHAKRIVSELQNRANLEHDIIASFNQETSQQPVHSPLSRLFPHKDKQRSPRMKTTNRQTECICPVPKGCRTFIETTWHKYNNLNVFSSIAKLKRPLPPELVHMKNWFCHSLHHPQPAGSASIFQRQQLNGGDWAVYE